MDKLPNIRKIAVLRATALGDFLAATPALYALREAYPDAEIVYLGRPWHKEFIEERPGPVNRGIVVPPKRGVRDEPDREDDEQELDDFFQQMQQEKFDLAIQMHGGGKNSNPFTKRLGARINVGMRTPDAPEMDRWMPYLFYQPEFIRLLELMRLVGATPSGWETHVEVTERDVAAAHSSLPELRPSYVVLHPGAGDLKRRWPYQRFAAVGDSLAESGFQVVVTGTTPERPVVAQVIGAMRHPAVNACDRLSLSALTGLFSRAALVISNDTGPLHLANAVGALNVGIFWVGNYMNWSHLGRTKHRPLASFVTHCPQCGGDMTRDTPPDTDCAHDTCFVEPVTLHEVLTAAYDLLAYGNKVGASFA